MGKATSSSSSSISSSSNRNRHRQRQLVISTASSLAQQQQQQQLPTDLSLGLGIPTTTHHVGSSFSRGQWQQQQEQQQQYQMQPLMMMNNGGGGDYCGGENSSFFVKVYMEGIPIGRKLNILAHESYHDLVSTLENMFDTTILWGTEMDGVQPERCHVLTYEDEEGDLVMVGDVPWEMFVSAVKRLKITRVDAFGC